MASDRTASAPGLPAARAGASPVRAALPALLAACGLALGACVPATPWPPGPARPEVPARSAAFAPSDPAAWGQRAHEVDDLVFDGGRVHFEMRWSTGRVIQTARNDYTVPVTIAWRLSDLDNLVADSATAGTTVLAPAIAVGAPGPTEVLASFTIVDETSPFYRYLDFDAQFGSPTVVPDDYAYAIPFPAGSAFRVLQGAGGAFSHTGSNQHAVDFACPENTLVTAARGGMVVATNDRAAGNGTTPEWSSYERTNFVLVAHQDGTLGQYMHLQPGGVLVRAGDRVQRGQPLARSGNTGLSTTPHLHLQVMTAADDGRGAVTFPFELLIAPRITAPPTEGRVYRAWERPRP